MPSEPEISCFVSERSIVLEIVKDDRRLGLALTGPRTHAYEGRVLRFLEDVAPAAAAKLSEELQRQQDPEPTPTEGASAVGDKSDMNARPAAAHACASAPETPQGGTDQRREP